MSGRERIFATGIIWVALAFILILADVDMGNFISLAVLVGGAFLATSAVWEGAKSDTKEAPAPKRIEATEKTKRSERSDDNRLARLIESLSEEDIARLDAVLEARRSQLDEDEQIELNRLLADQERARR